MKVDKRDMKFKDNDTMMDFLYDLGEKLPDMFEFTTPQNPDELIVFCFLGEQMSLAFFVSNCGLF